MTTLSPMMHKFPDFDLEGEPRRWASCAGAAVWAAVCVRRLRGQGFAGASHAGMAP